MGDSIRNRCPLSSQFQSHYT